MIVAETITGKEKSNEKSGDLSTGRRCRCRLYHGPAGLTRDRAVKEPKTVTLSGTVADLTCASKGKAMMDNWHNAKNNDHMRPDGTAKQCATMCLQMGQPAALFASNDLKAVFACNPRSTLANFAA